MQGWTKWIWRSNGWKGLTKRNRRCWHFYESIRGWSRCIRTSASTNTWIGLSFLFDPSKVPACKLDSNTNSLEVCCNIDFEKQFRNQFGHLAEFRVSATPPYNPVSGSAKQPMSPARRTAM